MAKSKGPRKGKKDGDLNGDEIAGESLLLDPQYAAQLGANSENLQDLVLLPKKKKKKGEKRNIVPKEVEQLASQMSKSKRRKLEQLQKRKEKAAKRGQLVESLKKSELSNEKLALLQSSKVLNPRATARGAAAAALRRRQAGLALGAGERDALYRRRGGAAAAAAAGEGGGPDTAEGSLGLEDDEHDTMMVGSTSVRNDELDTSDHQSKKKLKTNKSQGQIIENEHGPKLQNSESKLTSNKGKTYQNEAKKTGKPVNKHRVDIPNKTINHQEEDKNADNQQGKSRKNEERKENEPGSRDTVSASGSEESESGSESENEGALLQTASVTIGHQTRKNLMMSLDAQFAKPQQPKPKALQKTDPEAPQSAAAAMLAQLAALKKKVGESKKEPKKKGGGASGAALGEEEGPPAADGGGGDGSGAGGSATRPAYVPRVLPRPDPSTLGGQGPHQVVRGSHERLARPPELQAARLELPVCAMEQEIMEAVAAHDAVILCGETGSGKSTQLPQFLFEAGYARRGLVGATQPRRVAAVSCARRVAREMGTACGRGGFVAYQIRYDSQGVTKNTKVKFMTDGILLQEISQDLLLRKYSAIILDEAHERNLNTDVLLGMLSRTIVMRREAHEKGQGIHPLKLVIMSATLRVEDFTANAALFPRPPPVVCVAARQHPVTVHFSKRTELHDYLGETFKKVCKIHSKLPEGGILVFLTGQREILHMCRRLEREFNARPRRAAAAAAAAGPPPPRAAGQEGGGEEVRDLDCLEEEADAADGVDGGDSDSDSDQEGSGGGGSEKEEEAEEEGSEEAEEAGAAAAAGPVAALPLFAMLPPDQQARVFRPPRAGHRLIVVATNVAETSITIPGIKYVVDCGRAKERRLHHASGVAQFEVGWISQASADQRAGRAGRTGPGHCYRLYSSAVYLQQFPQFAEPEVATRALEDVVLQMKAMGVPRPDRFPFPTPPAAGGLRAAQALLEALGAARAAADGDGDEAPAPAAAAGGGEGGGGGGAVTPLGRRMAALPVGVRFAKMLVVGAAHGVLGHTVALAAALAERDPFLGHGAQQPTNKEEKSNDAAVAEAETLLEQEERRRRAGVRAAWAHPTSDALARLRALGAAAHALAAAQAEEEADPAAGGRRPRRGHRRGAAADAAAGGGEPSPRAAAALAAFCRARLLHAPTVGRALSLRAQLHRLARLRLRRPPAAASAGGGGGEGGAKEREEEGDEAQEGPAAAAAARLPLLPPPTPAQEELLKQVFLSGHLDCVARRAPPGTVTEGGRYQRAAAYLSCNPAIAEPLYLHRGSDLYAKDPELQPKWVCYQSVVRRPRKDGSSTACMACVTAIDPAWLAALAAGTPLLRLSPPLQSPPPFYDPAEGALRAYTRPRYGAHAWELPAVALGAAEAGLGAEARARWLARLLLEGKVVPELAPLANQGMLNDPPAHITLCKPQKKVVQIVNILLERNINNFQDIQAIWKKGNNYFLHAAIALWIQPDHMQNWKKLSKSIQAVYLSRGS